MTLTAPFHVQDLRPPEPQPVEAKTAAADLSIDADQVHRLLTVLAALGLFGVSFATWTTAVQVPVTCLIAVCGFAFGLGLAITAVCAGTARTLRRVDLALLLLSLVLVAGWAISSLYFQPGYGTDEAAFEQFAANLLLHGHNPYGANLLPALNDFRVPIQYATYTMNGGVVSHLSYPALPVLLVAAMVPFTHGVQAVIIVNVLAMVGSVAIAYRLLPGRLKSLAVLTIVGLPIVFGYAVAGVNAVIMTTFLLVVAHRWVQVGATGRLTRGDWLRGACLGLAISTQPLAWFISPFLIIGIYLQRRGHLLPRAAARIVVQYAAAAVGVFLTINAPFIIWNPGSWLRGVTDTLTQHAIPYGQGLVDATLFFHAGGGALHLLTLGAAALLAALLLMFALFFRRLGRAAFFLPSVALFFPTRSLAEYFMTLVGVWMISIATTEATDFRHAYQLAIPRRLRVAGGRRGNVAIAATSLLPAIGLFTLSLATPSPLTMRVLSVSTTGQLQTVWQINIQTTNNSADSLTPHFATNYQGQASTFWNILHGPAQLKPHQSARYVLAAPNSGSMPGITTPFVVQAVTAKPETVSSTRLFTPQPYTAALTPSYVNQVLHKGDSVTIRVQLRSPFGSIVRRAGVQVALAQLIYAQDSLIPAEATINGAPQGQTPVYAATGVDGVAAFRIRDTDPQNRPISFQAWLQAPGGYPFGYSQILPILWTN